MGGVGMAQPVWGGDATEPCYFGNGFDDAADVAIADGFTRFLACEKRLGFV